MYIGNIGAKIEIIVKMQSQTIRKVGKESAAAPPGMRHIIK